MSWLDLFPYTNFHELNLDWFLRTFVKLVEDWTQFKTETNARFDSIEEELTALKKYMTDYFADLDVQEEINNKLDTMTEDGTLAGILATIRDIDGQTISLQNLAMENYHMDNTTFLQVQGMCINEQDGTMIYAMIPTRENQVGAINARVIKRSIYNFQLLQSRDLPLRHANGMTFNPETRKIYVSIGPYIDDQGVNTASNLIGVVDYDTLNFEEYLSVSKDGFPYVLRDVCYDKDTGKTWIFHEDSFSEIDIVSGEVLQEVALEFPYPRPKIIVSVKIKEGYIYELTHGPDMLAVYALDEINNRVTLIKEYTIPYWCGEYLFVGETESFDFFGEELRLMSFSWDNTQYKHSEVMFFRVNLKQNVPNGLYADWWSVTSSVTHAVYVDSGSTELIENGTINYPFKSLQTAINTYRNGNPYKMLALRVRGTHDYTVINNVDAHIALTSWTDSETDPHAVIKGLYVYGSRSITISQIDFDTSGADYPAIRAYYVAGRVNINNSNLTGNNSSAVIAAEFSQIFVSNCEATGGTYAVSLSRSDLYGTVVYSAAPNNRVRAGVYSHWYTDEARYMAKRQPGAEFTTTSDDSFTMPSLSTAVSYGSNPVSEVGTVIELGFIENANMLFIMTQKGGRRAITPVILTSGTVAIDIPHGNYAPIAASLNLNDNTLTITANTDTIGIRNIYKAAI